MVASIRNINARGVKIGPAPIPNPYTCNDSPVGNNYALYFEGFTGPVNDPLLGMMGNKAFAINEWTGAQNDYDLSGDCLLLFNDYVNNFANWMYFDNLVGFDVNVTELAFRVRVGINARFYLTLSGGNSTIQFDVGSDTGSNEDRLQIDISSTGYAGAYTTLVEPLGTFIDDQFHTYKVRVTGSNTVELLFDDQVIFAPPATLPNNYLDLYSDGFGYGPYIQIRSDMQYGGPIMHEVFALDYIGIDGAVV